MKTSMLELRAINILERHKIEGYVREFRFHHERMWRFDFCWPDKKIALELEGGVFVKGRHTTGIGFSQDTTKYNQAVILGYKVLRYTTNTLPGLANDLLQLMSQGK